MKHLFALILLVMPLLSWTQINYCSTLHEATEKAQKQEKHLFIKYYAEGCSHCISLQQALDEPELTSYVNENFVSYAMEISNMSLEEQQFLSRFHIKPDGTPYLLFFSPNLEFVHSGRPKEEAPFVLEVLKTVFQLGERTSDMQGRYEAGERDLIFVKKFSKFAQLLVDTLWINRLANEIFAQYPKENLLSDNSLAVTNLYVRSIDNGFFKFWMAHFDKLDSVMPKATLDNKKAVFTRILINDINLSKASWNLSQLQLAADYVEITQMNPNKHIYFWPEEAKLLIHQGKLSEALALSAYLFDMELGDPNTTLYVADTYINLLEDKSSLITLGEQMPMIKNFIIDQEQQNLYNCYLLRLYKKAGLDQKYKEQQKICLSHIQENNLNQTLYKQITSKP